MNKVIFISTAPGIKLDIPGNADWKVIKKNGKIPENLFPESGHLLVIGQDLVCAREPDLHLHVSWEKFHDVVDLESHKLYFMDCFKRSAAGKDSELVWKKYLKSLAEMNISRVIDVKSAKNAISGIML